ncbi:unnamed protein product, partial [marine sediment metagenome]
MVTLLKKEKRVWLLVVIVILFLLGINLSSFSEVTERGVAPSLQETLIQASEEVAPAVVNIRIIQFTYDSFFRVVPREGQGSGVIFSKEGYILTNEHVIHEAREINVVLPDGREFKGKLIGSDPSVDLAVVKVTAKNLPLAKLGNSDKLRPGEFCIAIGNPFGLQNTLTFGVISAMGRDIGAAPEEILENLIQTQAPINPGNSGGPLINLEGEVIGINTAIIPYAQGIGFAIPINTAKEIIDELISYGRVIRPWLGIYSLCVTPQVKERFNLSVDSGCYIVEVVPQSPAEKGGIKEGDVIVKVNDQDIKTINEG